MTTSRAMLLAVCTCALFAQCGSSVHYVRPVDLRTDARRDSLITAWSPQFKGLTIFLDPGHGGDDRKGVGPAGDVVEADVNLRVALRLRDDLVKAGARVVMSREADASVPLSARAQQANVNNADIFLSIHHNATANDWTNYTACFYHAHPGDMAYKASSHDLARYIQRDLAYVMGNPGPLASFDGTMSDYEIYPNEGFQVLRDTRMTSVLVECSFFSSAYEEQRLRDPEFNDIQAWGIFRGIARYLQAGIPALAYAGPMVFASHKPTLGIAVKDLSDIRDESVRVFIDGREEGFSFNRKTGRIALTPTDELSDGYHLLSAQVRNAGGNSSAPFEVYFAVGRPPAALRSVAEPAIIPPVADAYSVIEISAVDSAGSAVPDGLPLRFQTSHGVDTMLTLRGGIARIPLYPGARPRVTFSASNGPIRTEGAVTTAADARYVRGFVLGADGRAIVGAEILLPGGRVVTSGESGEYIISGANPHGIEISIRAPGWYTLREALTPAMVQDPFILSPVANGVLHGKAVLIDLFTPTAEKDGSRIDGRVARALADLVAASGGHPLLLHELGSRKRRDSVMTLYPAAPLIQLGEQTRGRSTIRINGVPAATKFAGALTRALAACSNLPFDKVPQRITPPAAQARRMQCALILPAASQRGRDVSALPWHASNTAWALYEALLLGEGFATKGTRTVEAVITDKKTGNCAAFIPVELNGTIRTVTDARGVCVFRSVSTASDDVRAVDPDRYIVSSVKTAVE